MKAQIGTDKHPVVVHQAVPEAVTLLSSKSPPLSKCFDHRRNMDHPMEQGQAELPAAS
uniref:Uncharacterized protein n=1 Tax=Romanomermis culicivorax TaxID=13658 RepID=A0A915K695_ROMCU